MAVINAADLLIGRLASYAAKQALLGHEVTIVNCEKAVVSGRKNDIVSQYRHRRGLGEPQHGPFYPRRADMIVRRTIRGMLPYKTARGEEAFRRIKCYLGMPENIGEMASVESAHVDKMPNLKFMTVGELSKLLGSKLK